MTIPDHLFLDAAQASRSAREAGAKLGVCPRYVSRRLSALRRRGVPDVPEYPRGRPPALPSVLQVALWHWIIARGVAHRKAPGSDRALCLQRLVDPVDVDEFEALGFEVCGRCWPVGKFPPTLGDVPPALRCYANTVVVEHAPGQARYYDTAPGGHWRDIETYELAEGTISAIRWWAC